MTPAENPQSEFVAFWNYTLAAKFERYREILMNGRFEATDGPVTVGDSICNAIDFQLAIGPAGEVFREAGHLPEERRDKIDAALRVALAP